jgi:hypothetical protein
MGYDPTRPGAGPNPYERLVLQALAEYCFEPTQTDRLDWCPTAILYTKYCNYAAIRGCDPDMILGVNQFGVALRRAFDIDPARKSRHYYRGERACGYRYVQGPGSIKVMPIFKRRPKYAVH